MGDPELVLVGRSSSHFTPARAPSSAGTSRAASWPTPRDDPARHGHRGHRDHGRTRAAGAAEGAGRLENALGFLEANVDRVLAALPPERLLSFCEAALYALVTHLPFRKTNVRGPAPPSIASMLPKARSRSRRTVGSCIPACDFRLFCGRDRHLRTVA